MVTIITAGSRTGNSGGKVTWTVNGKCGLLHHKGNNLRLKDVRQNEGRISGVSTIIADRIVQISMHVSRKENVVMIEAKLVNIEIISIKKPAP